MNCIDVCFFVDWGDCLLLGGDKLSGGKLVCEGEIIDDGVDKLFVGKLGDLFS